MLQWVDGLRAPTDHRVAQETQERGTTADMPQIMFPEYPHLLDLHQDRQGVEGDGVAASDLRR